MKEGDLVEFWSSENGGVWKPAIVTNRVMFFSGLEKEKHPRRTYTEIRLMTGPGVFIIRPVSRNGRTLIRLRANNESNQYIHKHRVEVLCPPRNDGEVTQP